MGSKSYNSADIPEEREVAYPPAHTAEHLLNQTMIRLFGCGRSYNAHVERKKSKMSFHLDYKPSRQEEKEIERRMNDLIEADLPVTFEYVSRDNLPEGRWNGFPTMPPTRYVWCASATTTSAPA